MKRLSKQEILRALEALSQELGPSEGQSQLVFVGGAALVLLYDARESTRDVDAVLAGRGVMEAAKRIAGQLELPEDWLNDAAKGFLHRVSQGPTLLEMPNLVIRTVALEQLLAMKLSAWRDDLDIEDARLLLGKLTGSKQEILRAVQPFVVPGRELKAG